MNLSSGGFYGIVLKTVSIAEFKLTETVYTSPRKLPAHTHESTYFCFVLEGNFTEFYGTRSRTCSSSTIIFHPAGETHSDHFHTDARCLNVQLSARWLERVRGHSRVIDTPVDFSGGRLPFLAARLYSEFRGADDFSSLAVEGLLLEVMAEASRLSARESGPSPPLWLRQARGILDERFGDSLPLVALSGMVGVHPVHLAREFRRFYRCTVAEYVRRRRIEFARQQLSASDTPLSDIALAAGFFDQSHFGRTFKRLTGMSPAAYRETFRAR